jgi:hypothetical protein
MGEVDNLGIAGKRAHEHVYGSILEEVDRFFQII